MNAYDFFPDCALQCGIESTGSCEVTGNFPNGTLLVEEITCDDLKRVSSNLEAKRTNLADAVHIYVNHGELIPQQRQLLRAGRKGCTHAMLLAQRQTNQVRFPNPITYEYLKTGMAKMNMFLPRDIQLYLLDSLSVPKDCNVMTEFTMIDADAELFVIYDKKDKRWIPCLDDFGAECSLGRKSIDEDTVITQIDNSEGWTLNDWFSHIPRLTT